MHMCVYTCMYIRLCTHVCVFIVCVRMYRCTHVRVFMHFLPSRLLHANVHTLHVIVLSGAVWFYSCDELDYDNGIIMLFVFVL